MMGRFKGKRFGTAAVVAIALCASLQVGGANPVAADDDYPPFLQQAYSGDVTVEVMAPRGNTTISSEQGSAEIAFSPDDRGHISVTGFASVNGEIALRFEYLLTLAEDGSWRDDGMTIRPDGQIEMLRLHEDAAITALGSISAADMVLYLRRARLDWTGSDDDTELDLAFSFDLTSTVSAPRPRDPARTCATVIWQPRVMTNIYGGSTSTVMVPVCTP